MDFSKFLSVVKKVVQIVTAILAVLETQTGSVVKKILKK